MTSILKIPAPLGATWDGNGVNFAVHSSRAEAVELCLFDSPEAPKEFKTIPLTQRTGPVWRGYLPDARPGLLYGYRVHGPFDPKKGLWFNPAKLLLDPYAKALGKNLVWDESLFSSLPGKSGKPKINRHDSAPFAPRARVIDPQFDWEDDRPPDVPWNETFIYETHVKGLTRLYPRIPEAIRGGYGGLCHGPVLEHFKSLGVTTVELMPVMQSVDEHHLYLKGLKNYWGYNPLCFFAPDSRFCSVGGDPVREFKQMVKGLHRAGLEVILDVVYNHTAEGNHLGPTLSLCGFDNPDYYHLNAKGEYVDYSGCGNTLDAFQPAALDLIVDSLRYWVREMHVDGFRFDLATALARGPKGYDKRCPLFEAIREDPVFSRVKWIAEPWDLGADGYQLGNFPEDWREWNGQYRDTVRKFWRGDPGAAGPLATRIAGSSDLYQAAGRNPSAGINYAACHDGFPLRDLVSYKRKHNEKNLENNRDGSGENFSWNCGAEGDTNDSPNPKILNRRMQYRRNLLATVILSKGVPMISGGDELGRTQKGNNNAYCQDNEISWYSWNLPAEEKRFLEFVRRLVKFRRETPCLLRDEYFSGRAAEPTGVKDLAWFSPDGEEMTRAHWDDPDLQCLGMQIDPRGFLESESEAEAENRDDALLILINAATDPIKFTLPGGAASVWSLAFNTADDAFPVGGDLWRGGDFYTLFGGSMAALKRTLD